MLYKAHISGNKQVFCTKIKKYVIFSGFRTVKIGTLSSSGRNLKKTTEDLKIRIVWFRGIW